MMLRSPISILLALFIQALTLAIALDPWHPDESTVTITPILQDVLKEISTKQKWNLEEVRFTKLEVKKLRIGSGRSFEIRIRLGKSRFVFIFPDEVTEWRRRNVELEEIVKEVNSSKVLDPIVLKGPLELRVGGDDDRLSLALPMNISHMGLKRVLVSDGISVEIREAQAVSLFHSANRRFAATVDIKEGSCSWSSQGSVCVPLPPIHIIGSASLVAFRTQKADSQIKTSYLSDDTIQLLPEKCYDKDHTYKQHYLPNDLLGLKVEKLEKALSSLGGNGTAAQTLSSLTAKLKVSGMVRFQLEIERRIGSNESETSKRAEWRTKPKVERVWFEVKAKVEGDKLKAVGMRKVVPFIEVDTEAWSSMMSNMSFTKFPSILGPQEALTLDVKW
ncbi:unnamed protein product [Eruca vesicaria subsp. sativa]|uniref:Uncharacterized protein n=1 Tax=Eruca vesicaria subsp. sativa TaxID=29727 RepID=A0ABC8L859_ERUVS|nr:unnamed protein product [Eruca vesicaria subsp. sativa]